MNKLNPASVAAWHRKEALRLKDEARKHLDIAMQIERDHKIPAQVQPVLKAQKPQIKTVFPELVYKRQNCTLLNLLSH